MFAGSQLSLKPHQTSPRACAADYAGNRDPNCAPIIRVDDCASLCTPDSTKTYYTQCTYNGKSYHPLATRMQSQDINLCGDGVCQFTESCGTSNGPGSCQKDCGACP